MASGTGGGRPAELLGGVAILASDLSVAPLQRKDLGVIESVHAVFPIVAGQAVLPEVLPVLAYEFGVMVRVAGWAGAAEE